MKDIYVGAPKTARNSLKIVIYESQILRITLYVNHPSVIDYNMHRTVLEPIIGFSDTLCVQGRTNLRNLRKSQFVAHTICRPNIKHDK